MNVFVFSVSIGHGHNQVAKALAGELTKRGHHVQVIDALEFVSPFFSRVLLESYLTVLRYTPNIYGRLYQLTEEPTVFDFTSLINSVLSSGFKKLVSKYKPDAIICTHPFPTGLLAALKGKLSINIPLIAAITDFTVHNLWVHAGVNHYITATPKLDYQLRLLGIPDSKRAALGIPIRRAFVKPPIKSRARKVLGLTNRPTLLVMGGGLGMGASTELVYMLDHYIEDCQIMIVAGTNVGLYEELKNAKFRNSVMVHGFIDNVEAFMAAADLLITKPGGITAAEALAMGLPMAFVSPIPGQEWRNAAFLVEQLVAVQFDALTLAPKVSDLLNDTLRLSCMAKMAKALAKPNSTSDTVDLLESIVSDLVAPQH